MLLADRIKEDLKKSLKSGESERAGVLRLLLAEIQNKQKEKFGAGSNALSDEDTIQVFQKEAKKRKEAIELFRKGGREDLIRTEEAELKIIAEFLPKAMTPEEVGAVVDRLMAGGLADFNSLIREAMKELKGRADGKIVGDIIKKKMK